MIFRLPQLSQYADRAKLNFTILFPIRFDTYNRRLSLTDTLPNIVIIHLLRKLLEGKLNHTSVKVTETVFTLTYNFL